MGPKIILCIVLYYIVQTSCSGCSGLGESRRRKREREIKKRNGRLSTISNFCLRSLKRRGCVGKMEKKKQMKRPSVVSHTRRNLIPCQNDKRIGQGGKEFSKNIRHCCRPPGVGGGKAVAVGLMGIPSH